MAEIATCPIFVDSQCHLKNETSLFLFPQLSYISLASSSLSCIGASSIIITYLLFRELKTGLRSIITYLSIADFITAFGFIIGGVNYLVHYDKKDQKTCYRFEIICSLQSFITTWSQLSSYMWTCILAFYLFGTIVVNKNQLVNKLIPVFHVAAWGLPIAIVMPLLATEHLGYSPYASANWCFIKDKKYLTDTTIVAILAAGKLPEFISFIILVLLYTWIKCHVWRVVRTRERGVGRKKVAVLFCLHNSVLSAQCL